jgi:hypothetical protein
MLAPRLCWMALLATMACDSDGRDPGELLSGELTGQLGGEPFAVQYGLLWDWDDDWGARLWFADGPATCDGAYPDPNNAPQFHAWIEMQPDPGSGQDWIGPYIIMQNSPRLVFEFDSGELHLDRVDEHSASGHLAWRGAVDAPDEIYSLEGTSRSSTATWNIPATDAHRLCPARGSADATGHRQTGRGRQRSSYVVVSWS